MGHPTQNQLPIPPDLAELLAGRIRINLVESANGCWVRSSRAPTRSGYTTIARTIDGVRRNYYAHRVMYVAARGAIPVGYTIDHICNNRACCNPGHLRAVTHYENVIRGEHNCYAVNARKTHCPQGHPLPPYVAGGKRACKKCRAIRQRTYRQNKRGVS